MSSIRIMAVRPNVNDAHWEAFYKPLSTAFGPTANAKDPTLSVSFSGSNIFTNQVERVGFYFQYFFSNVGRSVGQEIDNLVEDLYSSILQDLSGTSWMSSRSGGNLTAKIGRYTRTDNAGQGTGREVIDSFQHGSAVNKFSGRMASLLEMQPTFKKVLPADQAIPTDPPEQRSEHKSLLTNSVKGRSKYYAFVGFPKSVYDKGHQALRKSNRIDSSNLASSIAKTIYRAPIEVPTRTIKEGPKADPSVYIPQVLFGTDKVIGRNVLRMGIIRMGSGSNSYILNNLKQAVTNEINYSKRRQVE